MSLEAGTQLADLHGRPAQRRALLRNGDRLIAMLAGEHEESSNHFLGLREGTIDNARTRVPPAQPDPFVVRFQRLGKGQETLLLELLAETHHLLVVLAPFLFAALR